MIAESGDVLVVGAGPTGLALAGALRTLGVDVTLIEANTATTPYTKATNLMQGTQEQLAIFGVMDAMQSRAGAMQNYMMYAYGTNLSPRDMHLRESPYSDVLFLGQNRIEEVLSQWLGEAQQQIHFGHQLDRLEQDADGVDVLISTKNSETQHRFKYVVGCDGPRSTARSGTRCDFKPIGTGKWVRQIDATLQWKRLKTMKSMWLFYYAAGFAAVIHLPNGISKFMTFESKAQGRVADPSLEEMQSKLREISGDPTATLRDAVWVSHGELLTGVAPALIDGRIVLAGDAGNPILPNGGQGLNVGIQDSINLAWKLSDVLKGYGTQDLLLTYETERRALRISLEKAQRFVLEKTIDGPKWFRSLLRAFGNPLLNRSWPAVAKTFSQLGHNYLKSPMTVDRLGRSGVRAGQRVLDADVVSASTNKEVSLFKELLFPGWKCLIFDGGEQLTVGATGAVAAYSWISTSVLTGSTTTSYPPHQLYYDIDRVAHKAYGITEPALLLIRPDNYVALRTSTQDIEVVDSYLRRWFRIDADTRAELGIRTQVSL